MGALEISIRRGKRRVMRQIPGIRAHGGSKCWRLDDLWNHLLGEIDYLAQKDLVVLETYGGERGPKFNKPFDPSSDEV
jgi:hypothetical protein